MIIEFTVKNFRSFWHPQTLQMTALSSKELEENTFETRIKSLPKLIKSAVIYGPNASGKSNIVKAAAFMKRFIMNSAKDNQASELIKNQSFLFVPNSQTHPSRFEMIFISGGVRYQYGFELTSSRVNEEWLIAYPEGRPQRWFERNYDKTLNEYKWRFSSKFKGPKKTWRISTRKNALFLSTAIQLNNQQLQPIFNWFKNLVVLNPKNIELPDYTIKSCMDSDFRGRVLKFMRAADFSIKDIKIEKEKFRPEVLPKGFPAPFKNFLLQEMEGKEMLKIFLSHTMVDKKTEMPLPLSEESDGTQKLFSLSGLWLKLLDKGQVFFIDELDCSLHPYIMEFLIDLIHNPQTNPQNGQLIFTTHNTHILNNAIFRRDQIWFVEKDELNATHLFPLSDFKPRKKEALEKGYLAGRYGAIPLIKRLLLKDLVHDKI